MDISVSAGTMLLIGALDVRSVGEVRSALSELMDATPGDVVLDVSGLELIDVTGLGMLAGAHRRAEQEGRHLLLRGCQGPLRRVLARTRLASVLHLEDESLPA